MISNSSTYPILVKPVGIPVALLKGCLATVPMMQSCPWQICLPASEARQLRDKVISPINDEGCKSENDKNIKEVLSELSADTTTSHALQEFDIATPRSGSHEADCERHDFPEILKFVISTAPEEPVAHFCEALACKYHAQRVDSQATSSFITRPPDVENTAGTKERYSERN